MADKNALTTEHTTVLVDVSDDGMFSDKRLELIRRQSANGAPEDMFLAMIEIARSRGLDPLAKQISLINFGGTWQICTTIDGYRAIAESTGAYAGSDAPVFVMGDRLTSAKRPIPESATVTVWKLINGTRYPFSATVYWDEYAAGAQWPKMPRTMLAKVGESQALRKGFPKVLSGVYTTDEMDQAGAIDVQARVVNQHTGEVTSGPRAIATPEDAWERASKRLHAVASEHQINHDVLHAWAVERGYSSLRDVPTDNLIGMANSLEQRPQDAQAWAAKYAPQPDAIDIEPRPITTGPPTADEMDAALASATPTSLPFDVPSDRYTR